jgi:ribose-phosphate pyrophosphokinase
MIEDHPLRIFSGSAHPELAREIASLLGSELGKSTAEKFPDSETHVEINEVVRGQDIFFIQPCSTPVNDNLMELILTLDAFRRASAHTISVVIPYFPYARQERMAKGREAISARVAASMIESMGVRRVIFVDIHNPAIQGFFTVPVDPVSALPVFLKYFTEHPLENSAIVSPDVGRTSVAGKYAEKLNMPLVVMHKRRMSPTETKTTHVVGDIKGHRPIIVDDMIASGSVLKQLDALYERGAVGKAWFAITHPILLPGALELLDQDDRIGKLIVTNTIPVPAEKMHPKIEVISIAPLLADIIHRIYEHESITPRLV